MDAFRGWRFESVLGINGRDIMYWLKGCNKCGGDLYLEKDRFGSYVSCLQCGAVRLNFDEGESVTSMAPAGDGSEHEEQIA